MAGVADDALRRRADQNGWCTAPRRWTSERQSDRRAVGHGTTRDRSRGSIRECSTGVCRWEGAREHPHESGDKFRAVVTQLQASGSPATCRAQLDEGEWVDVSLDARPEPRSADDPFLPPLSASTVRLYPGEAQRLDEGLHSRAKSKRFVVLGEPICRRGVAADDRRNTHGDDRRQELGTRSGPRWRVPLDVSGPHPPGAGEAPSSHCRSSSGGLLVPESVEWCPRFGDIPGVTYERTPGIDASGLPGFGRRSRTRELRVRWGAARKSLVVVGGGGRDNVSITGADVQSLR